ncbi:hypothetical protein ABZ750_23020 [Micromonospora musae]
MSTYRKGRRTARPRRRPRLLMTGGLLAGSLVVGAAGVSGVAATAGERELPLLDAVQVASFLSGDDAGRQHRDDADSRRGERSGDGAGRPEGRYGDGRDGRHDDGPGTGRHPVLKVPCDADKLVAALEKVNAQGGGSLRLAPKCTYTLTEAFDQPDDYDGGITDARQAADSAENAGGAAENPAGAAQNPAGAPVSPGATQSPAAAPANPGAAAETPGGTATTPGDAEAPAYNPADDKAGLPAIYQPITIDGAGATIERDEHAEDFRFLTVRDGGELFLRDVELRNGRSKIDGGAVYIVHGATAVIERVTVVRNTSLSAEGGGGGIFNDGNLVATDVGFFDNDAAGTAGKGGGLLNGGVLTLRDATFRHNSAKAYGGGFGNYRGAADVEDAVLVDNSAKQGGGMASFSARTKVLDTKVLGNSAEVGGGIANSDAVIVLRGMTIRDNSATVKGGGISTFQGLLPLDDSVVAGNTTDGLGGGIHAEKSNLLVRGSDVAGNEATGATSKGGGIYATAGKVSVFTSKVVGNRSTEKPGGLFVERAQVQVDDESVIRGNDPTNCAGSAVPVENCFR